MNSLMSVKDYAQQVAEAISTVVKIDIEIADKDLVRIAGTGKYRSGVGKSMNRQGFVYREVLRTAHQYIIETPGRHSLCAPCPSRGNCSEKYEMVSPINIEGKAVGAIGLICFTEEQAQRISENLQSFSIFLTKMAESIGLKLKEQEYLNGLVSSNHYLNSIIDCLEEGLITVDLEGRILHFNRSAQRLFSNTVFAPRMMLNQLLPVNSVQDILIAGEKQEEISEREVRIEGKQKRLQLVIRTVPIISEEGTKTIAITLRPFDEISRIVNRLSIQDASYTVKDILGTSEAMVQIRERAKIVAASKSTVLIRGESGTGKEMVARAIHTLSPRNQGSFVAINCTAIPEALLESELFGYEDGAFTGARKGGKIGKFELANRGTLFLDEIGDMPLFLQVKILRVLQERRIERVGGVQSIPVDVRIIAATHRDLEKMMSQGEFREDLYYRINVIPLIIEPLRNRKEDIDILCENFIKGYNTQLNKDVQAISPSFRQKLLLYCWPGNVRELQNVIEYAMNLAEGLTLDEEHLPARIRQTSQVENEDIYNLELMEREMILRCLSKYGNTVVGKETASKALGIGVATLYRKLSKYNLA